MRRRRFAVVLILSWLLVCAIAALDDFRLSSSLTRLAPVNVEAGSLVNNSVVESTEDCRLSFWRLLHDFPSAAFLAGAETPSQKNFSIHKRYRVFII
jgi:hypothetical protein